MTAKQELTKALRRLERLRANWEGSRMSLQDMAPALTRQIVKLRQAVKSCR